MVMGDPLNLHKAYLEDHLHLEDRPMFWHFVFCRAFVLWAGFCAMNLSLRPITQALPK